MAECPLLVLAGERQEGYIRKTKSLPLRGPLAVHKATGGHGFPYVTLLNPSSDHSPKKRS